MNKAELVAHVSVRSGLSKRSAAEAVEAVLAAIQGAVTRGEKVTLPGFGTFERRRRAARTARNPRSGKAVRVPATSVPAFRPGLGFKVAVSGKGKASGRGEGLTGSSGRAP